MRQLGPRVHGEALHSPLAPFLPSSGASISAKTPGLQLNVSVCTPCLPAEALVTGLAKIPRLRVLAAPGTLIPSAQRLVWAAKQPLGKAALGALFA